MRGSSVRGGSDGHRWRRGRPGDEVGGDGIEDVNGSGHTARCVEEVGVPVRCRVGPTWRKDGWLEVEMGVVLCGRGGSKGGGEMRLMGVVGTGRGGSKGGVSVLCFELVGFSLLKIRGGLKEVNELDNSFTYLENMMGRKTRKGDKSVKAKILQTLIPVVVWVIWLLQNHLILGGTPPYEENVCKMVMAFGRSHGRHLFYNRSSKVLADKVMM
ncbi:hypothetical protein QJS10_CPA09g02002 [Acorus calamus]|uniref:Uncharacterized protein n=1 Tax=Acorus calamus TaxID=4465 RepID=A0AAV9E6Y4_ACOCL|nr:hypothetical protein QJS10_CPA09g02002 [Acorus calamus]